MTISNHKARPQTVEEAVFFAFQRFHGHFRNPSTGAQGENPFRPDWNIVNLGITIDTISRWISIGKPDPMIQIRSECAFIEGLMKDATPTQKHTVEMIFRSEKYAMHLMKIEPHSEEVENHQEKPVNPLKMDHPIDNRTRHQKERQHASLARITSRQILIGLSTLLLQEISRSAGFPVAESSIIPIFEVSSEVTSTTVAKHPEYTQVVPTTC